MLASCKGQCDKESVLLNTRVVHTLKFNTTFLFYRISFEIRLAVSHFSFFCFVLFLKQMHGRPFGTDEVFLSGQWHLVKNMHVFYLSASPGVA